MGPGLSHASRPLKYNNIWGGGRELPHTRERQGVGIGLLMRDRQMPINYVDWPYGLSSVYHQEKTPSGTTFV